MESWERIGQPQKSRRSLFSNSLVCSHFSCSRSPFPVDCCSFPVSVSNNQIKKKNGEGGGGLLLIIKLTQKHNRALIKYKASQHLVGQTSHIFSLWVLSYFVVTFLARAEDPS